MKISELDDKKYGRKLLPTDIIQAGDLCYKRSNGEYINRAEAGISWVGETVGQRDIWRLTPNEDFFRTYERGSAK